MLLLVGLGNPGPEHVGDRHNIGFMVVDEIMRRHGFASPRMRFRGRIAEGKLGREKTFALEPITYMNESGISVGEAVRFYKIPLEQVIVIYDEIDLALGKIRVKRGGGHAGHNGIRSIDSHIGNEFLRVRVGVGHPGDREKVSRHVLSSFAKAEQPVVDKLVTAIADAIPLLVRGEEGRFMSKVSLAVNPPKPKPDKKDGPDAPRDDSGADGDGV